MYKIGGQFTKVEFKQYSIDSNDQLKDFLFSLGWKPDEWNYKEGKKTSPKISISSLESIDQGDLGRWIKWYLTLKHRRNYLSNIKDPENKGVLSMIDERGRVPADAFTCGTPTARMRHTGAICNVPKCNRKVLYGCEMRGIYVCYPPYVMMGSDLSGIEARLLGYFTSFFDDGLMARELLDGDIHSKNAGLIGKDRDTAKTFFYALLYGAGVGKMAAILECDNAKANKIIEAFYNGNPGLKKLKEYIEGYHKKYKYIKGIDGRPLFIRSNHILLNSLIQGSAAIIFKKWGCEIWNSIEREKLDSKIIISYHDEYETRTHESCVDRMTEIFKETLDITKEFYKITVDLDTDTKVGSSWAEVH